MVIENLKILKLLLEKKPDLTIKNKKGQTAIDITNSKTIISIFWHYLTGSTDSNTSEENKTLMATSKTPRPLPKANPVKKTSAKLVIADTTKGKPKSYQDPKVIKTTKDKDLAGSETLSAAVLLYAN